MAVNIDVNAVYNGSGFEEARKDANRAQQQIDRELKAQIRDRQRLLRLSRGLERDITREQREQERALKAQISQRRRLNTLTKRLDRQLDRERDERVQRNRQVAGGDAGAVVAGAAVAADLARTAAEAERLEQATDALGRRFGLTGEQITRSIQEASSFTISKMDAMRAANQAMLLGVVNSEEEFAELAQIAIALGRAMGQDATKSIEDITIGLGRQSKLILDNLGIIVDTERAYNDYAAQLGKTADELTEAEKKQAFINETLRAGRDAVQELGNVSLDSAGKIERLSAGFSDLQVSAGKLALTVGEQTGTLDALSRGLQQLSSDLDTAAVKMEAVSGAGFELDPSAIGDFVEAAEGLNTFELRGESLARYHQSLKEGKGTVEAYLDSLLVYRDAAAEAANATIDLFTNDQELAEALEDVKDGTDDLAEANQAATSTTYELGAATEDQAEKLEKLNDIRRDFARSLIDIDEESREENADAWQDFFDSQEDSWQDYQDRIEKARKAHAKDLAKIDRDLAKDLSKLERETEKDIEKLQKDQKREETNERRRRQIDALGDERLFNFELRQLAAEGEALAIEQALERRAIEEEIAREKAQVEKEIEDAKLSDEIDRVREAAAERRAELEAEAAEEKELERERLAEIEAAEEESYFERFEKLRQYREEKLVEIENSKQEALAALGEELAEAGELTKEQLEALTPVAGQLGENAGKVFAFGLNKGFEENEQIEEWLEGVLDAVNDLPTASARVVGRRSAGGGIPEFQTGGSFVVGGSGGPDSQLIQFMATPGERVEISTPEQQRSRGNVTITQNINNPTFGDNVSKSEVIKWIDEANQFLVRELEEMLN